MLEAQRLAHCLPGNLAPIMAGRHEYHCLAANRRRRRASSLADGRRRLGVVMARQALLRQATIIASFIDETDLAADVD